MITRSRQGWRFHREHTAKATEMMWWIIDSYGHVIAVRESLTKEQFAERIQEHYSMSEPRNYAATLFLRTGVLLEQAEVAPDVTRALEEAVEA